MGDVLLATDSVHTTAAACDALAAELTDDDAVVVLTVTTGATTARDAGDAVNVARTRLPAPAVEAVTRDGKPAAVIVDVARERDVDRIVLGRHRGDPETAGDPPGSTVRQVLATTDRPVLVVPV